MAAPTAAPSVPIPPLRGTPSNWDLGPGVPPNSGPSALSRGGGPAEESGVRWISEGTPGIHPFDSRPRRRPDGPARFRNAHSEIDDDARRPTKCSERFLEATFTLTSPLDVGSAALSGASVDVALSGDLTIHGVTRPVTIAGQARLNGDRIEIVASLTFPFSDFSMTPPDIAGFVQVEDEATLEVLLSLVKA